MNKYLSSVVCATAILLSSASVNAILAPACAQGDVSLSFDTFHDQLAPYGDWVYSDRWGEVWTPENVPQDFHPYGTAGHWAYTDEYGWTWASDYEWGDIPFHYGRWVNDPDDGWLWIPGYVWSPGWVVWRSNGQYTGWMPMPPDDAFLGGGNGGAPSVGVSVGGGGPGVSIDFNNTGDNYGYSKWYGGGYSDDSFAANWVFVGTGHMADRDFHAYEAPRNNYTTIIHATTNITNYTVVNNYVVNKSVDVHVVERASGHAIQPVRVADITKKPQFITHADTGREVQKNMRAQLPRGNGHEGSAPKPTPKVVQSLSEKVGPRMTQKSTHVYTRETVTKAPLVNKPAMGTEPTGPGDKGLQAKEPGTPPKGAESGAMTGGNSITKTPLATKPAMGTEQSGMGDKAHHENEPGMPPKGAEPKTPTPGNSTSATGASSDQGAADKTRMHRPGGEPAMTKPATTPTSTSSETHAGGASSSTGKENHRDQHSKATVPTNTTATPPNNGGEAHKDVIKSTNESGAKSVTHPKHMQGSTEAPKKPSEVRKDEKKKPKPDEPSTPQ
jgi:hypothetical protein